MEGEKSFLRMFKYNNYGGSSVVHIQIFGGLIVYSYKVLSLSHIQEQSATLHVTWQECRANEVQKLVERPRNGGL
jgi:hypothetical protein